MNAQEANERARRVIDTGNSEGLKKASAAIEGAANSGKFSVTLYEKLPNGTVIELERRGYKVKEGRSSQQGEGIATEIS